MRSQAEDRSDLLLRQVDIRAGDAPKSPSARWTVDRGIPLRQTGLYISLLLNRQLGLHKDWLPPGVAVGVVSVAPTREGRFIGRLERETA